MSWAVAPGNSRKLSWWSWAIAIPLAAALLYWSLRGVQWRGVWQTLAGARPEYLLAAAAITTLSSFLRAVRWRVLLHAEERLGLGLVFRALMVGYLGNSFLPARAGEVLRSVLISRCSRLSKAYVLTTALSERLMDVIAVVLAAALALTAVNPKPRWLSDASQGMTGVAIAGALLVILLPHTGPLIENLLARLPLPDRMRKFLLKTAVQVLLGLRSFHDWGRLLGFTGLTVLVWTADSVGVVAGARALNLAIPFPVAVLLLVAMALGSALPSTPGYIGIYQFAAVMVLGAFRIPAEQAVAYSVVAQVVGYVVVVAFGVPSLYASFYQRRGAET